MISAKVICDSVSPSGSRLITMEVNLPRIILAEFNTHRLVSRNFQSSRAVPVSKLIEQVVENPFIPVHWGKNQAGMVADEENSTRIVVEDEYYPKLGIHLKGVDQSPEQWWVDSARIAAHRAEKLHEAGYHKQIVNRLLEPFMWTKGVVTATLEAWEAVLLLRNHKDAQPEFQVLAKEIKKAITDSNPQSLDYGDWHLPYIHTFMGPGLLGWEKKQYYRSGVVKDDDKDDTIIWDDYYSLQEAIKISVSCCAQVSYRMLDESLEKANKIYEMLNLPEGGFYKENLPHFSPAEHVAVCHGTADHLTGNYHHSEFAQYRKILEHGCEEQFLGDNIAKG